MSIPDWFFEDLLYRVVRRNDPEAQVMVLREIAGSEGEFNACKWYLVARLKLIEGTISRARYEK